MQAYIAGLILSAADLALNVHHIQERLIPKADIVASQADYFVLKFLISCFPVTIQNIRNKDLKFFPCDILFSVQ